jgi:ECF transporter S component (folate family)
MKIKRISVRTITYLALLAALEIVLNRFCSINTMGLKIGFSFVPIVVAASLFGPVHAAAVYALADFLGAILFPIGPYHPGFTVCAALMGFVWGIFLHTKEGHAGFLRILVPSLINNLVIGLLVNTAWVAMLYGSKTYAGWFLYRLSEYAVLVPLNLVITPVLLRLCRDLRKFVIK